MRKNLIFDFDGTLANSFDEALQILSKVENNFGLNYSKEELRFLIRNNNYNDLIKEFKISKLQQILVLIKIRKITKKKNLDVKLYDWVPGFLKEIKNTHTLFLLTSNKKEVVEPILKKNNILQHFTYCSYGANFFRKKNAMKKLIKKYELNESQTYYIGDELRDFKASIAVNINPVIVSWGFNSKSLLKKNKVTKIIDNKKEFRKLFLEK